MFTVSEADAAAIRTVYEQDGELSAAIELRRRFPGITDNEKARLRQEHRRVDAVARRAGEGAEADARPCRICIALWQRVRRFANAVTSTASGFTPALSSTSFRRGPRHTAAPTAPKPHCTPATCGCDRPRRLPEHWQTAATSC